MYLKPADYPVSSSWQDHKNRNPPSSEPGTDYALPYGTPIALADNGTVTDVQSHNGNATGRYVEIRLNDGRTVRYLHMSTIYVGIGYRLYKGNIIGKSGASGYGSDYYYGPHVHVTLWPGQIWQSPTIDFELYVDNDNESPIPEEEEENIMRGATYTRASDGVKVRLLFNEYSGWYSEVSQIEGDYVNSIAENWETNAWPTLTESHATAIKRDLDKLQKSNSSNSNAQTARVAGAAALVVIAIVLIVTLFI